MRSVLACVFAGCLVVVLAGCPPVNSGTASLRVIQASPDAVSTDVAVNRVCVFQDLAFGSVTSYTDLQSGFYEVNFLPQGSDCYEDPYLAGAYFSTAVALTDGDQVTMVSMGKKADMFPLVLGGVSSTPAAGKALLRVVHASPDMPKVDVTQMNGGMLFNDVAFEDVTDVVELAAGTYTLQVRNETSASLYLAVPDVFLASGRVYTAYVIGLKSGAPALQVMLVEEN